jgi:hypothetical protein
MTGKVLQRCKSGDRFRKKLPRCELFIPTFGEERAFEFRQFRMRELRRALIGFNRQTT